MEGLTALGVLIPLEPWILAVVETCQCILDDLERLGLLANANYHSRLNRKRRNVNYLAINNNVANLFQYEIRRYPGLAFCMCGHEHKLQVNEWFGDGILYYECGAAKKRQYIVFHLLSNGTYDYEVVNY